MENLTTKVISEQLGADDPRGAQTITITYVDGTTETFDGNAIVFALVEHEGDLCVKAESVSINAAAHRLLNAVIIDSLLQERNE